DLREGDRVRISVLNAIGQEVAVLADGPMAAGRHNVAVPVGTLADGLYLVRLVNADGARVVRFTVE
ncbi:MAG: T9SS type A sorting domain-containing protein, partial [Flavobacteriales bacterium]|nr:T9SS type A sorting domain-containing protein [Flavobacteriales bacterium]